MKRILIYLLLISFLSVVLSCDNSLELGEKFKPFKINIPEETTVTVPVEGGSFDVFALTVDENGKRLGLSINNMGEPWSYGDYDYYENELCKITYNRITRIAKVEVYCNETGKDRTFYMDFCPCGPVYSGYSTKVLQYGK